MFKVAPTRALRGKRDLRKDVLPSSEERREDIRIPGSGTDGQSAVVHRSENRCAEFSKSPIAQGAKKNIVQYLGIAADEPTRIERHTKPNIILPLVDIGWDEAFCRKWCEENDLLSPIYTNATRGGCWFCHNQRIEQLRFLRKEYPELWQLLLKWDSDSPATFKSGGITVHNFEKRFAMEDAGVIKAGDKKFKWKQVLEDSEDGRNYAK